MNQIIFAVYLLILASCGSESGKSSETASEPKSMLVVEKFPEGKALFQANCAACHHPLRDAVGPALKGVVSRVPSKEWIYNYVKNPNELIASDDAYAVALFEKWHKTTMPAFPNLTHAQIDEIINYCEVQESKTVD